MTGLTGENLKVFGKKGKFNNMVGNYTTTNFATEQPESKNTHEILKQPIIKQPDPIINLEGKVYY